MNWQNDNSCINYRCRKFIFIFKRLIVKNNKNKFIKLSFPKKGEVSIKISDDIDLEEFEYSVISILALLKHKMEDSPIDEDDISPFLTLLIKLLDSLDYTETARSNIYDSLDLSEQQKDMAENFKLNFSSKYNDLIS